MTKEEFLRLCEKGPVCLDGATGSNLQKSGMPLGVCPEKWITENPEALIGLQHSFLEAGAGIIYAPTFTANRVKLSEYGLEDSLTELNHSLIDLSREAIKRFEKENGSSSPKYVAGDLTMTGVALKPTGSMDFEELIEIYKEQVSALLSGGVDLFVVETMMSLNETRAAVIAIKESCDLPIMATLTFEADGKSLYGTDPLSALITLQSLGVSAFGANCSTGPEEMRGIIKRLAEYAEIPIIAKPNAGLPEVDEKGETAYRLSPEDYARDMKGILEAGANIVGGCCGTTPKHIAALSAVLPSYSGFSLGPTEKAERAFLCSEREVVELKPGDRLHIIGERINPTGKKKLQAELKASSFELVRSYAESQEEKGASLIIVNTGMPGVDEKALLLKAIEEVGGVTHLPLVIDTSVPEIMEAALRLYPGRALLNSISLESERSHELFRIAKKYGAMVVLLPLSDKGIPKDLEERKANVRALVDRALSYGLKKRDLIVDGLVATVGAEPAAALNTLMTLRYCHEELGLFTLCGLSNISFGLPGRPDINAAFLSMCVREGLTLAIANPEQESIMSVGLSSSLLMNRSGAGNAYISFCEKRDGGSRLKESEKKPAENALKEEKDPIFDAVLKGKRDAIAGLVKDELSSGREAKDILDNSLLPAIDRVGELFDEKRYFLPQLIAGGETMKNGIEVLEPLLHGAGEDGKAAAKIVIATVEGDIHDIGKNLVVLMLRNQGFEVIDLGKDVPAEEILERARAEGADIVGLSALMTTTMQRMKEVAELFKSKSYNCPIMIGGAVVTKEYADEIGAYYSSDAADAVKMARNLFKLYG